MGVAQELGARQLDALREAANIGAGHAATALSQLTNLSVMISVPTITVAHVENMASLILDTEATVTAVLMRMLGDGTGHTLLIMPDDTAKLLSDMLLQRTPDASASLDELEQSSLKEAGNILGGAYLSAMSTFTNMMFLPSAPTLVAHTPATDVIALTRRPGLDPEVICKVETKFFFEDAGRNLMADFLLIPDSPSIKAILDAIVPE
jgi:chemotaxis protein CheC